MTALPYNSGIGSYLHIGKEHIYVTTLLHVSHSVVGIIQVVVFVFVPFFMSVCRRLLFCNIYSSSVKIFSLLLPMQVWAHLKLD